MTGVTFITGNQDKADFAAKFLGMPVAHHRLDLEELQEIDLRKVVEHKARQAYAVLQHPVLVEDASLEFSALGRLPGTFIKWFEHELGLEGLCRMLDTSSDRSAVARVCYGYADGNDVMFFEAEMRGVIADSPRGDGGFGWDQIFVMDGYNTTRGELDSRVWAETSYRIPALAELKEFLESAG